MPRKGTPKPEKPIAYDPDTDKPIFAFNENGHPICNSRKRCKPEQDRCKRTILCENGRCAWHGGKSLATSQHPNCKTLQHSVVFQRRMQSFWKRLYQSLPKGN
jgi:hypothetical protein